MCRLKSSCRGRFKGSGSPAVSPGERYHREICSSEKAACIIRDAANNAVRPAPASGLTVSSINCLLVFPQ